MTLGERIKKARKQAGLTQKQLADMINAKHNSVSNWETGQNEPSYQSIKEIAQATGVPLEELTADEIEAPVTMKLKSNKIFVDAKATFGTLHFDKQIKVYTDSEMGPRVIAREYRLTYTDKDGNLEEAEVILPGDVEEICFEQGTEVEVTKPRLVPNVRQMGKVTTVNYTIYADEIIPADSQQEE